MDGKFRLRNTGEPVSIRSPKRFVIVVELVPGRASVLYRSNKFYDARDNLTRHDKSIMIDTVKRMRRVGPSRPAMPDEVKWVEA